MLRGDEREILRFLVNISGCRCDGCVSAYKAYRDLTRHGRQAGRQAGWLATTELQTLANANEREQSSQKKRQKNLDREGDEWSGVVV